MFHCKISLLQVRYCFNSQKYYLDLFQSISWKQPTVHVHKEIKHFWHHQTNRHNWVVITIIIVNLPEMLCWGPLPFCWGCCCAESVLKGLGSPILPITSFAGWSTVNSITISTFLWRKKNNMRITKYFWKSEIGCLLTYKLQLSLKLIQREQRANWHEIEFANNGLFCTNFNFLT